MHPKGSMNFPSGLDFGHAKIHQTRRSECVYKRAQKNAQYQLIL